MIDYANIHSMDAEEGRRLHNEHFTVAKQKSDQLYKRVQAARTMQVDPFNWHKSIGRGGRVASAFSMLTGQIAAGAGNPSSAMKMMDAAIERDISAQAKNIENEYNNLKLVKGLNENDRALYMEEMGSLNETRAVRYGAMLAKLEAAKQHAINESAYNSYKVMGDHYTMKLLEDPHDQPTDRGNPEEPHGPLHPARDASQRGRRRAPAGRRRNPDRPRRGNYRRSGTFPPSRTRPCGRCSGA
jgi:hypothetical protein